MLLTIDRGNSSLDVLLHADPPLRWRAGVRDADDVLAALAALVVAPTRAIGSTVVPGGLDQVAAVLAGRGVRLELAGRELACPLAVAYADPTTLGTDRWLAALAAFAGGGAAVVVQCGTALTVDAVDAAGRFLGGAIAPGLRAMAAGLAAAAPRLPPFRSAVDAAVPGVSSQACVDAGVVLAFCGAVERLVHDVARALPATPQFLLSGGDAAIYLQHGRLPLHHVDDLVHRGLRCLAETYGPRC